MRDGSHTSLTSWSFVTNAAAPILVVYLHNLWKRDASTFEISAAGAKYVTIAIATQAVGKIGILWEVH
jgi:hypothetical protein